MTRQAPAPDTSSAAAAVPELLSLLRRAEFARAASLIDDLIARTDGDARDVLEVVAHTIRLPLNQVIQSLDDLQPLIGRMQRLEMQDTGEFASLRDWALSTAGHYIASVGAIETGMRWTDRAILGARQRNDLTQLRRSLNNKASVVIMGGAFDHAASLQAEALSLADDKDTDASVLLNNLATTCILRARRLPEEEREQRQALGTQALTYIQQAQARPMPAIDWHRGWLLANTGHAHRLLGHFEQARQAYEQALPACGSNLRYRSDVMANHAALMVDMGQAAEAEPWLAQAEAIASNDLLSPVYDLILETQVRLKSMTGRHEEALAWSERRRQRAQDRYERRMHHALSDDLLRELEQARIAEQEAQARARALDAASAAKSSFVAHMSHEIRTPIHAILGLAQLLHEHPLPEHTAEKVQGILEAGDSLLHIVNDILDLSKIEAGQMPLQREPMSVPDVLQRVDRLLRPAAQAKGLALTVQADASSAPAAMGDAAKLEQVLVNLVGNAVKFTGRGEVRVRAMALPSPAGSLMLRLEVSDTGVGIPPAALERLFTPFTQADDRINRQFGGTGLGLAISRRLVDLMGGRIGAVSVPGQGSTFWCEITLDLAPEPTAPAPLEESVPAPRRGDRLQGLRVLAADDNRLNRLVIQRQLQREGAQVQLAEDGVQALEALRARPEAFDVVLMDVQMPALDGLSATRAMRADPALAQLPVIALTAGVLAQDEDAARAAGMNEFIAKPVDLERLVTALSAYRSGSGSKPKQN